MHLESSEAFWLCFKVKIVIATCIWHTTSTFFWFPLRQKHTRKETLYLFIVSIQFYILLYLAALQFFIFRHFSIFYDFHELNFFYEMVILHIHEHICMRVHHHFIAVI